jgi:sterol desaturase/sphingolipid hydroxylase (fatty acid hydroxylase superfamily)
MWFAQFAPWDLADKWWMWPALFVVEDFFYYWYHRAGHEMRFFWAAHVSHHSSQHYNLSTALRQSVTTPFTGWVFWVPVVLLGFPVEALMLQKAVSLLYQYWIHTETIGKLGPLEWVFNTPSHHRVHHASNLRYLDKNYGGILIVWDRMFGTFEPERDEEPVRYGLLHNLTTHNPGWIALHEWVSMVVDMWRKPSSALGYLFRRPGWHPDARSATVPELLARAQAGRPERVPAE